MASQFTKSKVRTSIIGWLVQSGKLAAFQEASLDP